jgi:hypothetical protein
MPSDVDNGLFASSINITPKEAVGGCKASNLFVLSNARICSTFLVCRQTGQFLHELDHDGKIRIHPRCHGSGIHLLGRRRGRH